MKSIIQTITLLCFIIFTSHQSQADDKAVNGLLIGMGSGALLGQVIGGDTESTVMGTAVGGILGYVIGSDQQQRRHHRIHRYHGHRHHYYPRHHRSHRSHGHYNYRDYSSHTTPRLQERRSYYHGRDRDRHHRNSLRIHRSDRDNHYNTRRYHGERHQVCRKTEKTIYKNGRSKTIVKKVCTNERGGRGHRVHSYR